MRACLQYHLRPQPSNECESETVALRTGGRDADQRARSDALRNKPLNDYRAVREAAKERQRATSPNPPRNEKGQVQPVSVQLHPPAKTLDGSVDIYIGPKSPAGQESNWIQTPEGKVCLRNGGKSSITSGRSPRRCRRCCLITGSRWTRNLQRASAFECAHGHDVCFSRCSRSSQSLNSDSAAPAWCWIRMQR